MKLLQYSRRYRYSALIVLVFAAIAITLLPPATWGSIINGLRDTLGFNYVNGIYGPNGPYYYTYYNYRVPPSSGINSQIFTTTTTTTTTTLAQAVITDSGGSSTQTSSSTTTTINALPYGPDSYQLNVVLGVANYQNVSTGPNFQQMVTFNPSKYLQSGVSDLGNIRFYQSGNELFSWCESGCSSSSTNAVFWVLLPQGLMPNSYTYLTMRLLPANTEYDGVYAGEAPQLSSSYGKYDNGNMVFTNYSNFYPEAGINISGDIGAIVNTTITSPGVMDSYAKLSSSNSNSAAYFSTLEPSCPLCAMINIEYGYYKSTSAGLTTSSLRPFPIQPQPGFHVWSIGINGTTFTGQYDYNRGSEITFPSTIISYPITLIATQGVGSAAAYWLRTRSYPPYGIMPTVYTSGPVPLSRPTIGLTVGLSTILVNTTFFGGSFPYTVNVLTSNTSAGCASGTVLSSNQSVRGAWPLSVSAMVTPVSKYALEYYCVEVSDSNGATSFSWPVAARLLRIIIPESGLSLITLNSSYGTMLTINQSYTGYPPPPFTLTWYSGSSTSCAHDANVINTTTLDNLEYAGLLVSPANPTYYCVFVNATNWGTQMLGPANVPAVKPSNTIANSTTFYSPPSINGCSQSNTIYNQYLGAIQPCQNLALSRISGALYGSNGILASYLGQNDTSDPIISIFDTYYNQSSVEEVVVSCQQQSTYPCMAIFYFNSSSSGPNLVGDPIISG
ncbi:MAG: hypothetical protein KGH94_04755 [Candidatus Micrarchaeota archaeon]|nr:hypothetical protein [Candidatus Micrarchaeota archaeon]